jgi:glycosyltransferase involved in cell wall biosynthesis
MTVSQTSYQMRRAIHAATIASKLVNPRRVLQVITPSHMSGAETQVCRLTKQMRARGHEMRILVKHDSSALEEMQRRLSDVYPARIGGKGNVFAVPKLMRIAKQYRAELLQSNLSTASWWCGWAETFGGPKSIGHVHGFTSARWHRRQSHLLAVSGAVRDDLIEQGIPGERITVLHNALSPEEFTPTRDPLEVRAEFGADAKTPVVGTFAHLSEKKGYRELFGAMPRILKAAPTTQFWIMGTGALRGELEETARAGGYLNSVRFAGFRRDSADVMNAIDVLALPSRREPCALVYVEAALLAKPIVACRAGGAPESVAEGETGILVPVNDSLAIAEAVLALLENRDVARRMGQAGRDRALDIFSWTKFIATLEGVYEKVLS